MTVGRQHLLRAATLVVLLLAATWITADALSSPHVVRAEDEHSLCPLAQPPGAPVSVVSGRSPRLARICFVPIGEPKTLDLVELASHYQERFGTTIGILPPIRPKVSEYDILRRQLIAEELVALMRRSYPTLDADPTTLLIGFTEADLYIRSVPNWDWAFAGRMEGRFSVISTARMDPFFYREEPSPELLNTRARKITTKTIGLLYFGLPLSSDPRSVLYDSILGLDDLDAIGEDF
jgi:predicted Zn-dependent protease